MKKISPFSAFPPHLKTRAPVGFSACPDCDLLLKDTKGREGVAQGRKSSCPRCGSVLYSPGKNSVERTLALSLTGLILFPPAMLLPVMTLDAMGLTMATNLVHGIFVLFGSGFHAVAILVLLTGVAVPFIKLLVLFVVSLSIQLKSTSDLLILFFRLYQFLDEWGMLEIYMLGILVSIMKLKDLARLSYGMGLFCFTALLIITVCTAISLDEHRFWSLMDKARRNT